MGQEVGPHTFNVVGGVTITIHCTSTHMAPLFPSVFRMCTDHPTILQMAFGRVELVHKNNHAFFRQRTANPFHHHRSCNISFHTLSAEEVGPKQNHCPRIRCDGKVLAGNRINTASPCAVLLWFFPSAFLCPLSPLSEHYR
jgi:hypothetical protein